MAWKSGKGITGHGRAMRGWEVVASTKEAPAETRSPLHARFRVGISDGTAAVEAVKAYMGQIEGLEVVATKQLSKEVLDELRIGLGEVKQV